MSVTFAPGTDMVEELSLGYGGMAATTVLAKRTADRLLRRRVALTSILRNRKWAKDAH